MPCIEQVCPCSIFEANLQEFDGPACQNLVFVTNTKLRALARRGATTQCLCEAAAQSKP